MLEGAEYSLAGSGGIRISDPSICKDGLAGIKKKKNKNKRRFSDEQIRSLELMFESETRLEPRKKIQVARELGLQPRQVAIWFQNKRARWKSKQLEKEYNLLRANYNNLASQYEALQKEKQALVTELENLNDAVPKTRDASQCCGKGVDPSSIDPESDGENTRCEPKVKQGCFENGAAVLPDNDTLKTEVFGFEEEPNLMSIVEPADSSLTTSDDWGSFNSDALLNQSSSSYPWWDFWS